MPDRRTASSAWSTASISTNGCASAPRQRGPSAAPARSSASSATPTASAIVALPAADGQRRAMPARPGAPSSAPTARVPAWRAQTMPGRATRCPTSSPTTRSSSAAGTDRPTSTPRAATSTTSGKLSPDFYAWVFPHGDTASIGTGTAHKGFSLRGAVGGLRKPTGLDGAETIRREGAPIPLKPLPRWDNGRDVVLAGDAAGVVAPPRARASTTPWWAAGSRPRRSTSSSHRRRARARHCARKRFMKAHGRVFWVLGMMQHFWYVERPAARALRQHLQGQGRAAA